MSAVVDPEIDDPETRGRARVFATFCTFLKKMGNARRWRLNLRAPGWPALSSDEQQLLNLLAAAQAGDDALFEANLRWLARPRRRHALRIAACALAAALTANDLILGTPQPGMPARREPLRPVTATMDEVVS